MANLTAGASGGAFNSGANFGSVPTNADNLILAPSSGNCNFPSATTCPMRSLDCVVAGNYTGVVTFDSATALAAIGDGTPGNSNIALRLSPSMTLTLTGLGAFNFVATSPTQQTITTNGKVCPTMAFLGAGGSWILNDTLNTPTTADVRWEAGTFNSGNQAMIGGRLNFSSGGARTVTLGSSAIQAFGLTYGNMSNVTLTPNTAVVTVTNTLTGLNNIVVMNSYNWQGLSLVFNNYNQATINIHGATIRNLTINGTANQDVYYRASGSFVMTGNFSITGNSLTNRVLFYNSTPGVAAVVSAASTSISNADFMDIQGAGAASWAITSGYVGDWGGNSNIAVTTPLPTVRNSLAGSWSDPTRWSAGRVPLPQDNVRFDSLSANTTMNHHILGGNLDFTGYTGTLTRTSTNTPYKIFGSLIFSPSMSMGVSPNTMYVEYRGRGNQTITSNGVSHFPATANQRCDWYAPNGNYVTVDGMTVQTTTGTNFAPAFSLAQGTLDLNGQTHTIGQFSTAIVGGTRTLIMTGATLRCFSTNAATIVNMASSGLTIVGASSATFEIINNSANGRTITLGGTKFCKIKYALNGSTGALLFNSSGDVESIEFTDANNARLISISAGVNLGILDASACVIQGTVGKLMSIVAASSAGANLEVKAGGRLSMDYVSMQYIRGATPYTVYAGANSVDVGGNLNVGFTVPPAGPYIKQKAYVGSTGSTGHIAEFVKPVTPGSLLEYKAVIQLNPGAYNAPAGFTLQRAHNQSTDVYVKSYFKIADGTETTVSATWATSRANDVLVYEWTGFTDEPSPDTTDVNQSLTGVTSLSSGSGATPSGLPGISSVVFGGAGTLGASVPASPPTDSFQEDYGVTGGRMRVAAKNVVSLVPQTTLLNWTTSRVMAAILTNYIEASRKKIKYKSGGAFTEKTIKTKQSGVFSGHDIKAKVGGSF